MASQLVAPCLLFMAFAVILSKKQDECELFGVFS